MRFGLWLVIAIAVSFAGSVAFAHVTDGYALEPLPSTFTTRYVAHADEISNGEVDFRAQLPDPTSLTHAEQAYIGAAIVPGPGQVGYGSWRDALIEVLHGYYTLHHEVPARLSPEVIAEALRKPITELDPKLLEFLRSPVTNEYPRLDQREFSRGDMYVQRLTKSDIQRIAPFNPSLRETYVERRCWDPGSNGFVECGASEAFYIRKYGEYGVIDVDVLFMTFLMPKRLPPLN